MHFWCFGLNIHIGTDGIFTDSKTEAVFFPSTTQSVESVDTSPVYVNTTGYVTYSGKFKYMGSYVTQDLSDTYDVKNCALQATKALGAMMSNVFHTSAIQRIVNINMKEVQLYCIFNDSLYEEFRVDLFENIM
eukprot:1261527-Ditylum_brightwellii.AAC.1